MKNGKVEFYRFVFSLVVVCRHFRTYILDNIGNYFNDMANFSVEFFFILSGFLMAMNVAKKHEIKDEKIIADDSFLFLIKKYKNIGYKFLISFVIFFVCYCITKDITRIKDIGELALRVLPNFFLLDRVGWTKLSFNTPIWYLSAMFVSMIIIYPLCRKSDIFFKQGTLFIGIVIIGITTQYHGNLADTKSLMYDSFYLGFFKGFGELCLGVFAYHVYSYVKNIELTIFGKTLFTAFESLIFITIIYICIFVNYEYLNTPTLILVIMLVISAFCDNYTSNLFNNKVVFFLGKVSTSIYLSHYSIVILDKYIAKTYDWSVYANNRTLMIALMVIC